MKMQKRFEKFTVLIAKIGRNIKKIKNCGMSEYGLKSPHVSCLYYLYCSGELTATELSERCEEDKATISRSLLYLEEHGFLTRDGEAAKRYKSPLVLTDKGREVGKKIAEKIAFVLSEMDGGLTEEERVALYRSLTVISDSLETIGKKFD